MEIAKYERARRIARKLSSSGNSGFVVGDDLGVRQSGDARS